MYDISVWNKRSLRDNERASERASGEAPANRRLFYRYL